MAALEQCDRLIVSCVSVRQLLGYPGRAANN